MKMKKVFAAVLAATMVVSSGTTALAAGSGSAAPATRGSSAGAVTEETVTSPVTGRSEDAGSGTGSSAAAEAVRATIKAAGAAINVAGSSVKTSIAGAYAAKGVQGVAVVDSLENVRASLGLKSGQTPYIMVFDTNAKRSPKAMECVDAAVNALGGEVVAALNVDLGAKEKGKFITLSSGSAAMVVGLPKGVDTSKSVSVVCVRPGGATTILEDKDANPNTVTFDVAAGLGTYAIVVK